jgi:hypothetical protein
MDRMMESGFVDTFREKNKMPNQYTQWSQKMTGARNSNEGERLDYILINKELVSEQLLDAGIMPTFMGSDHCPIYVTLKQGKKEKEKLGEQRKRNDANKLVLSLKIWPNMMQSCLYHLGHYGR